MNVNNDCLEVTQTTASVLNVDQLVKANVSTFYLRVYIGRNAVDRQAVPKKKKTLRRTANELHRD